MPNKPVTILEYYALFPKAIQARLQQVHDCIQKAAPNAEAVISYSMPAFKQNGMLVFYAAYKNHIGFYPTASGIEHFKNELGDLQFSKGAIQFPLDKKTPLALIAKIVKFKVAENAAKQELKTKTKSTGK